MGKADIALLIDNAAQRHTAQLKKFHFLFIHSRHTMVGISQTNKGDIFLLPIFLEHHLRIGTYCQDLHATIKEFLVIISQTRQLRAAIRSHESAQKGKQYWLTAQFR